MKIWHPNRLQWLVMWATFLAASHIWLDLDLSDFLPNRHGAWGLPAYLGVALQTARDRSHLAFVILAMGGLLLWQLSTVDLQKIGATSKQLANRAMAGARRRKVLLVGILLASLVAAVVLIVWKLGGFQGQPAPAAGNWKAGGFQKRSPAVEANAVLDSFLAEQSTQPKDAVSQPGRGTVTFDPADIRPAPMFKVSPEEFLKDQTPKSFVPDVPDYPRAPVKTETPGRWTAEELKMWKAEIEAAKKRWEEERARQRGGTKP